MNIPEGFSILSGYSTPRMQVFTSGSRIHIFDSFNNRFKTSYQKQVFDVLDICEVLEQEDNELRLQLGQAN